MPRRRLRSSVLVLLAACTQSPPSLVVGDGAIELHREPDHVFTDLRATIDGLDAGPPQIADATARFAIPAGAGPDLHVEVDDDGDAFVLDVPNLLAPRALAVDAPEVIHAGEVISITSGVATDLLEVALYAKRGDDYCVLENEGNAQLGTAHVAFPLDLAQAWHCGDPPAAGAVVALTLELRVTVTPPIATCAGPEVHCDAPAIPQMTLARPIMLQR